MKTLELPRVIACPDYVEEADIHRLMEKLSGFSPDILGVKIPSWHNQNLPLLEELRDQGMFVVGETQIHNTGSKMRKATEAFLGRSVVPSAITVSPLNVKSLGGEESLKNGVVRLAHEKGVYVFGYADHNNLPHTDDWFHDLESGRFRFAAEAGFDAFELHATTIHSEKFRDQRAYIADHAELQEPVVIASKLTENGMGSDELIEDLAAKLVAKGVQAFYLGDSLMYSDDPRGVINRIVEATHAS